MDSRIELYHGDCLEILKDLPQGCVDLVLTDPPYGTTQNKWDAVLEFGSMWECLNHVAKPSAAKVFTASQPFSSALVMSNPEEFRHEWVWIKNRGGNFANSVREPIKEHEAVLVFSHGKWTYNKQMQERTGSGLKAIGKPNGRGGFGSKNYGKGNDKPFSVILPELRVPSSWQKFDVAVGSEKTKHPTQKPVALMEYLIKTYTNEGDTVLDFTMGSGTTGVAAKRLNRNFIGIELDEGYYEIAKERIEQA